MMIKSVKLDNINYLFNKGKHLKLKRCNLLFGKNASGKSSIANEINNQFGEKHPEKNTDVFLFNRDFINKNVEANDQLNALSLGQENIQKHKKLMKIESKINKGNSIQEKYTEIYQKHKNKYAKLASHKSKWLTACARDLRNNHITLVNPNYNKNNFYNDLNNNAKSLPKEDINKLKEIVHEPTKKTIHINSTIPTIKIIDILKDINDLLSFKMKSKHINSLSGITNKDKEKFAVEGMKIHQQNDICAFCGNKITSNRWSELHELFNNQYFKLITRINNVINTLMKCEDKISQISKLNINDFYLRYKKRAKSINCDLIQSRLNYNKFFHHLIKLLRAKENNINKLTHISLNSKYVVNLNSLNALKPKIDKVIKENNNYHNKMNNIKTKARNKILFSLIASKKKEFILGNPKFNITFHDIKNYCHNDYEELTKINNHLTSLHKTKYNLLQKEKNEKVLVKKINKYLKFLGDNSFRLNYDNAHNGEYYISSKKDGKRGIHTLSRGELNLISFFYFYYLISPNNPNNKNTNNKIIIFDDPMDSNDDDFQYLMTISLQQLIHKITDKVNNDFKYKSFRKYQLLIFTHNVNFYLNIKCDIAKKKIHLIHLIRTANGTKIQYIDGNNQDFCNSYQELWAETEYLYNQKQADFMINPIRRIIETFTKFNVIPIKKFYGSHKYARKLFNVNSHSIDDISTSSNGHSPDSIKHMLQELFYDNGYKKHFDNCWNMFSDYGKKKR